MKDFYNSYSDSFLTAILSSFITLLAFALTIFCFFIGQKDIPLGFLLGGVVISGLYFLSALAERFDDKKQSYTFSIIVIGIRMVVLVSISILIALMNYRWGVVVFNLFTFIASYTVGVISNVIIHLVGRKNR